MRTVPSTLVSYICCHRAVSALAIGSRPSAPPALLTRTSQEPTEAAKDSTEAGSVTSRATASPPISTASASRRSRRRAPRIVR